MKNMKNTKKKTYIESEIDKFLEKYEYKNMYISYKDYKNKFDTEKITKLLKKLHHKFINFSEFKEEYHKFMDNVEELKKYKSENKSSFSPNQIKIKRYARDLEDIVDLYNIKPGSDTSKKGEGLKILSNKQMLNRFPVLLAQIKAGSNSESLKNEIRQILYSLYRSEVLTKTVYNN